jgi:hypothetical protein
MKKWFIIISLFSLCHYAWAQDSSYIARHLQLDSIVISASRVNFDIPGFIKMVEDDTTFYKAFKNLRILSYTEENNIRILNKNGKVKASLLSTTIQHRQNGCRTMEVVNEKTTGSFYDRHHEYNYYTAELYASLFFTKGKVCGETNIIKGSDDEEDHGGGSLERHREQLKQLIFNPGQRIRGVPLIGRKVAIFDDDIAPMYNFSITSADYGPTPCYVFTASAKPEYLDKVVIKKLVTYFDKQKLEIVYRDYSLSYNTFLFDFDVNMQVQMTHFDQYMVPLKIKYIGNWKVPFKKREDAVFTTRFHNFSLNG